MSSNNIKNIEILIYGKKGTFIVRKNNDLILKQTKISKSNSIKLCDKFNINKGKSNYEIFALKNSEDFFETYFNSKTDDENQYNNSTVVLNHPDNNSIKLFMIIDGSENVNSQIDSLRTAKNLMEWFISTDQHELKNMNFIDLNLEDSSNLKTLTMAIKLKRHTTLINSDNKDIIISKDNNFYHIEDLKTNNYTKINNINIGIIPNNYDNILFLPSNTTNTLKKSDFNKILENINNYDCSLEKTEVEIPKSNEFKAKKYIR